MEETTETPKRIARCLTCSHEWIPRKQDAENPSRCTECKSRDVKWRDQCTPAELRTRDDPEPEPADERDPEPITNQEPEPGLEKEPEKVEAQLRAILPPEESSDFCHRIVFHGRAVCIARKPQCERCTLANWCDFFHRTP